ncbi:hypothetical protein F4821DRAFT_207516 [Hypoxylon rubiginosum]|uniref:Uncharacterized protein n=1 Tax=Hypoxylon rubiginosum TaxID=110542 RepID=A0ACC0CQS8_9PEZI|nr:hypothetical protein F4821DRAFT_207516 [Hypoxylon rubiginosum]
MGRRREGGSRERRVCCERSHRYLLRPPPPDPITIKLLSTRRYSFLCILLAELLQETAGKLSPELVIALRAKLCRRMAKLETEKGQWSHLVPTIVYHCSNCRGTCM